jgi:radical SAM superfamily enzyme YgiQ (UPF0313 family)
VPGLYEVAYAADGTVASVTPNDPAAPASVLKRVVTKLPPPVTNFIVPYVDVVHNRAAIEIMRGCTRGCRFCQAGMIFRPVRERKPDEVLAAVDAMIQSCGFEEVSFLSLSSSDYTYVEELVRRTVEKHGARRLSVGLPSLRIEIFQRWADGAAGAGAQTLGLYLCPRSGDGSTARRHQQSPLPLPTCCAPPKRSMRAAGRRSRCTS